MPRELSFDEATGEYHLHDRLPAGSLGRFISALRLLEGTLHFSIRGLFQYPKREIASFAGKSRIQLICEEMDSTEGLCAATVVKLRAMACRMTSSNIEEINKLTLDELADILEKRRDDTPAPQAPANQWNSESIKLETMSMLDHAFSLIPRTKMPDMSTIGQASEAFVSVGIRLFNAGSGIEVPKPENPPEAILAWELLKDGAEIWEPRHHLNCVTQGLFPGGTEQAIKATESFSTHEAKLKDNLRRLAGFDDELFCRIRNHAMEMTRSTLWPSTLQLLPQEKRAALDPQMVVETMPEFVRKKVRNWLVARYLNDPTPGRLPDGDRGPVVFELFIEFAEFLRSIDADVLHTADLCRNAGWIEDMSIELKIKDNPKPPPEGIQRLNLPLGRHRVIGIRPAVLQSPPGDDLVQHPLEKKRQGPAATVALTPTEQLALEQHQLATKALKADNIDSPTLKQLWEWCVSEGMDVQRNRESWEKAVRRGMSKAKTGQPANILSRSELRSVVPRSHFGKNDDD